MHQDLVYKPVEDIKRFDAISQDFETIYYNMLFGWATSPSFNSLDIGKGYFFNSNQDVDFTIVGTIPTSVETDIKQGMNLVGNIEDSTLEEFIPQVYGDHNVTEVGKRNSDGSYELATYYSNGWYNDFSIEAGKGYWLKANKDFTLVNN